MDRRTLLALLGGAVAVPAVVFGLKTCRNDGTEEAELDSALAVLERMREAIEASPDHLRARADALIEAGDPKAVFAFVRDTIVAIPPPTTPGLGSVRWGAGGALRSGMGTHTEKSLLLRDLLQRVGIKATVVGGALPRDFDRERLNLMAEVASFRPSTDLTEVMQWLEALGAEVSPTPGVDQDELEDLDAVAQRLQAAMGSDFSAPVVNWERALRPITLVHFITDDGDVWLNPNIRDAKWGEHGLADKPTPIPEERLRPPEVGITLSVAGDDHAYEPRPVLEARWPMEDVLGAQLCFGFVPPGSPERFADARAEQVRAFVPVVSIRRPGLTATDLQRFTRTGDAFTVRGAIVRRLEAERVAKEPEFTAGDPNTVHSMSVSAVRQAAYPKIVLEVLPRDVEGRAVWGLDSTAFALTQGGARQSVEIERNRPRPPRVFFAFDTSGSMPRRYQTREATKALLREVIARARAVHPDTEFNVAGLGTRTTLLHTKSGWLRDEEALVRHIDEHFSKSSSSWSALLGAVTSGADVAFLVSDASTREPDQAYWTARMSEGCPAVICAARKDQSESTDVLEAMAVGTGGAWYWADRDREGALAKLEELLPDRAQDQPYLLSFVAAVTNAGDANPSDVTIVGRDAHAPFTFITPSDEARKPSGKDQLTGLELTITIGKTVIQRTLAGVPPGSREAVDPVTPQVREAVQRALFGTYQVSIEGGPPTKAALLDSVVSAHLSTRPLAEALNANDGVGMLEALGAPSLTRVPPAFTILHSEIPGALAKGTYPEGHQLVLHSARPGVGETFELECDVLPSFRCRTLAEDPRTEWLQTQRVTLSMAAREAAVFSRSTLDRLGPAPLQLARVVGAGTIIVSHPETAVRDAWRARGSRKKRTDAPGYAVLPADLTKDAWWWVDRATGTTLGMLDRGAGGGVAETEAKFDKVSKLIDLYGFGFGKLGFGLGFWSKLEKAKLEHLKLAVISIIKMDGTGSMGDFLNLAGKQVRDEVKGQIQGKLDNWMKARIGLYGKLKEVQGWHGAADKAMGLLFGD